MSLEHIPVTVAMPVYNGGQYLDQAIASISEQTHSNIRIVILDNASTDDTSSVAAKWMERDSRVSYRRHTSNIGSLQNFIAAADSIDTEYGMIAAHDDAWSPDYIGLLLAAIAAPPGFDLAIASSVRMTADWQVKSRHSVPENVHLQSATTRELLHQTQSWWFYGLWRAETLRRGVRHMADLGNPWGAEYLSMYEPVVRRTVTSNNNAIFYQRLTEISVKLYSPTQPRDQYNLYINFVEICKTIYKSTTESTQLTPSDIRDIRRFAASRVGGYGRVLKVLKRKLLKGIWY